ncbi:hypothetical protein BVI434_1920011 [Burkholderia vietnamiensis]|nr:hypothetical protein BVI434_1920011 [Burkholderia vietnamiensis]
MVLGRARRAADPAARAGAAELVDEDPRARELHRLRQLRAVGDGGGRVSDEGTRHAGRSAADARRARRRDVQVDRRRLRVLHDRDDSRRAVGGRSVGRLLELGPEGNLGADRVAQLRGVAAHAPDEGAARDGRRMVGAHGPARDDVRVPRRQHVPVRAAQLRQAVRFPMRVRQKTAGALRAPAVFFCYRRARRASNGA